MWGQIKLVCLVILGVLVVIVFFQNTAETKLKFLNWEVDAPGALLYPGLFAVGFLAGVLTLLLMQRAKRKGAEAAGR